MTMVTLTGVSASSDPSQVHAPGCKDLTNARKFRNSYDFWTLDVDSLEMLALEVYGDIATDTYTEGTPEHLAEAVEMFNGQFRVMPCAPKLPAK